MLGHQKHLYVARILKKSLQVAIHAQFYMAIKSSLKMVLELGNVFYNWSVHGKKYKEGYGKNCKVILRKFDEYFRELSNEF